MTVLHEPFCKIKDFGATDAAGRTFDSPASLFREYGRWHVDASASSGFERHEHVYPDTVENSPELARIAARHRPFYERLYAERLDVTPWEA